MTKLSVIVPCYNCEKTLEEAIASIYRQDVGISFDVTMVDDGSTDGTYKVMQDLAAKHQNIKLVRHSPNRGGGAARNAAVANSDGDLIFCLDSDDILGPDFLKNMTRFWLEKRCDGVGISKSVKFNGSNVNDVAYKSEATCPGEIVKFETLLDGSWCPLTVTFLITRQAFLRVDGYPAHHAFDTQGIAFRFLCNGLTAYTCPDAVYYHRVNYHESYYLREASAGRINWNWLLIFDEYLYLFQDEVKSRILESELYPWPGRPEPANLLNVVVQENQKYVSNYQDLIHFGRDEVAAHFESSDDRFQQYWVGTYCVSKARYKEALLHFTRALELGFDYRIIYYKMLLASLRLSNKQISVGEGLEQLQLYSQPYPFERLPLRKRLVRQAMGTRLLRGPARFLSSIWDRLGRIRADHG